jgi:hypothetical protein
LITHCCVVHLSNFKNSKKNNFTLLKITIIILMKQLLFSWMLVMSLSVSCFAQWHSQTIPLPYDVSIPDTATSFMTTRTGDSSFLYKRTGSQAPFLPIKYVPNAFLRGCHFFNDQTGLICGTLPTGIYVWRTTDGGQTLTPNLITTDGYTPIDFFFINSTTGYLLLNASSSTRLYKTLNAGLNWILVSTTSAALGDFVDELDFITEQLGYRSNLGVLEKTTNGGISWQKMNTPTEAFNIDFITDQLGYYGSPTGGIYRTTNGGIAF